ncbi:MAG: hypothetical protein HOP21_08770, partial [Methylotenera sp.]|nr:hypothetical protein [Methylotenera sp.]
MRWFSFYHPLMLTHITIEFLLDEELSQITCTAQTETTGQTGVEIEALTA